MVFTMKVFCTVITFWVILENVKSEIFTSMADMENMVLSERKLLAQLKEYISAEEKKLNEAKTFMTHLNKVLQHVNESEDVGTYLGNPVNSYLMLKRFNKDWRRLEKSLEEDLAVNFNAALETLKPNFPTIEDHKGAIDALLRLQGVYKLEAKSLAQGNIKGAEDISKYQLNFYDIYDIGVRSYHKEDWPHAVEWLSLALEEVESGRGVENIHIADIIDHLAFALFNVGDVVKAFRLTEQLIKLRPNDQRIRENLGYFHTEMKNLTSNPIKEEVLAMDDRAVMMRNYEKLCRGETRTLSKKEQRHLKCWYRNQKPILYLKPQKVERVWVNPEVYVFRDIIDDRQVNWIKETAYPRLKRAVIQDPLTDQLRIADYRISKSAWLSPVYHAEVRKLQKRAEAVTGLDLKYAEQLQVADYGMGGQYEPHFDHATGNEDVFSDLGMGNRIATLLFYLSDVEAGGATVYVNTLASAAVFPSKNDAVFWFNLKRSGESNILTKHAGCPVLVGHKWISNWWIHEYGQEFNRRCSLNRNW